MDPHGKFLPPKNEEEFQARAKDITLPAAVSILDSLKQRKAALIVNIDAEIAFYEKVIKLKDGGED
jgi:hypothetical protein